MATHDYTRPQWGHDCYVQDVRANGESVTLIGWGKGIVADDYLILNQPDNTKRTTRYQIYEIVYYSAPPDMWRAEARFAPRQATVT